MAGDFLRKCLFCNFLGASVLVTGCTILSLSAFPVALITLGTVYVYECPAAPAIPVYVMVCGILALLVMGVFALPKFLCPAASSNIIWTVSFLSLVLFVFIWFLYGSYHIYSVYPPNYDKNVIDPNSSVVYSPTVPGNELGLTPENQNQSLPNLNQTQIINNNHTSDFIQISAPSNISSWTNGVEHLSAPQAQRDMAVLPHCDRTVYLFAFWTTTLVYVFAGHALLIFICIYGFMKIGKIITEYVTN